VIAENQRRYQSLFFNWRRWYFAGSTEWFWCIGNYAPQAIATDKIGFAAAMEKSDAERDRGGEEKLL
jgi:hypothetical protein